MESGEPESRHPTRVCGARREGPGGGPGAGRGVPPEVPPGVPPRSSPSARLYLSTRSCSSVFFRSRSGCAAPSRQVGQHPRRPAPHRPRRQSRQKLWPQGSVTGQASSPWQMMQPRSSSASHTGTVRPSSRLAMVPGPCPEAGPPRGRRLPRRLLRLLPRPPLPPLAASASPGGGPRSCPVGLRHRSAQCAELALTAAPALGNRLARSRSEPAAAPKTPSRLMSSRSNAPRQLWGEARGRVRLQNVSTRCHQPLNWRKGIKGGAAHKVRKTG